MSKRRKSPFSSAAQSRQKGGVIKHAKKTLSGMERPEQPRTLRLQKRTKRDVPKKRIYRYVWWLYKQTFGFLWQHKAKIIIFLATYAPIYIIFARDALVESSEATFASILLLLASLAYIWFIRHSDAGEEISVKEAYYVGITPLVPYFLLSIFIAIQSIPFGIGLWAFDIIETNIAVNSIEVYAGAFLWFALSLLSGYWLIATFIATYVVTIPAVKPLEAFDIAKAMVQHRRVYLWGGVLSLILPLIALSVGSAFLLNREGYTELQKYIPALTIVLSLPFVHTYMFYMYKSLTK